MALEIIISGGQTGVDRAALDAAIDNNFSCGGFCPKRRKSEDGIIDSKYPLQEHTSANYAQRTLENVLQSDGTLIIFKNKLKGGSALTKKYCIDSKKPYLEINAEQHNVSVASNLIQEFIMKQKIKILNVAGPRKSQWPNGYQFAYQSLELLLESYLATK